MKLIQSWLRRDSSLVAFLTNLPAILAATIIIAELGKILVHSLFTSKSLGANAERMITSFRHMNLGEIFLSTAVTGPIFEEFLFRLVPFWALFSLLRTLGVQNARTENRGILVCSILSCVLFGLMHGPGNVFIQGFVAISFVLVFLRWSEIGRRYLRGWLAAATVHGCYNAILLVVMIMRGDIST